MDKKQPEAQPWMWLLLVIAAALLILGLDPVGDLAKKWFGPGADKWVVVLALAILIFCLVAPILIVPKPRKPKKQ